MLKIARIYLDLETYRSKKENAFVDEKIVSAGLLIDETIYHEDSLKEQIKPVFISEWDGLNECQIVTKINTVIKEVISSHKFTLIIGFGILRFDIPLLIARCTQNSLMSLNKATKMWHDCITIDHAQQLLAANGNTFKRATLDNIIATAEMLHLNPPAHKGDGGIIRELYPKGKYAEINAHLKEDLDAIRWLDLYGTRKLIEISVKEKRPLFAVPYSIKKKE
ncbi:MAG: hypothetical protein NWF04_09050 [Candidatus Bathyarchaeota archaeon]|nr:hypothetical protein [Candidatus Bathyarchaeota archaeon]